MDPRAVAGLASRRTYPLRSAFTPTYNMAVNLVASMGRRRAAQVLEHSFAQFQTERRLGGANSSQRRHDARTIEQLLASAHCERGDFTEYAGLREQVSQAEAEQARLRRGARDAEIADSLSALDPGDIIAVPAGPHAGWAVIIDPGTHGGHRGAGGSARKGAHRGGDSRPHPLAMVDGRKVMRLGEADIDSPVRRYGGVRLPAHFHPAATWAGHSTTPEPACPSFPSDPTRPPSTPNWAPGSPSCGPRSAATPATAAPTGRSTPGTPRRRWRCAARLTPLPRRHGASRAR